MSYQSRFYLVCLLVFQVQFSSVSALSFFDFRFPLFWTSVVRDLKPKLLIYCPGDQTRSQYIMSHGCLARLKAEIVRFSSNQWAHYWTRNDVNVPTTTNNDQTDYKTLFRRSCDNRWIRCRWPSDWRFPARKFILDHIFWKFFSTHVTCSVTEKLVRGRGWIGKAIPTELLNVSRFFNVSH